jgi:hypothetical protein
LRKIDFYLILFFVEKIDRNNCLKSMNIEFYQQLVGKYINFDMVYLANKNPPWILTSDVEIQNNTFKIVDVVKIRNKFYIKSERRLFDNCINLFFNYDQGVWEESYKSIIYNIKILNCEPTILKPIIKCSYYDWKKIKSNF